MSSRSLLAPRFALLFLTLFFLMAMVGPLLSPLDPTRQWLLARLQPPGFSYAGVTFLLGSDELGRDLLARLLSGLRTSLLIATVSVCLALLLGGTMGMIAGYRRQGFVEPLLLRLCDVFLSIPAVLMAVLLTASIRPGLSSLLLVLVLTRWPRYVRIAHVRTRQVVTMPYIDAARLSGCTTITLLFRHILPNIAGPLIVLAASEFGLMILFEASLSFLGLGIQPPSPSLGGILNAARSYIDSAWWLTVFPIFLLFGLVLSINILASDLQTGLDPQAKGWGG